MSFDSTVYIKKLSNTKGQVICEDFDFVISMREKFSYFADGYRFSPAFKNKQWDGKVRMLESNGVFNLGLWKSMVDFCDTMGQQSKVDPAIRKFNLPFEKFQSFVDSLDVHTGGDSIDPYDYQVVAAHKALEHQRCILLSPTSSGKSLIQYMLARMYERLIKSDEKMLVVVPTVGLVSQMKGDFADYSSEIEWCADDHVHQISAGADKTTEKRIIVSTYQSLAKVKPQFFHQFGVIMVDEVHTATAKSIIRILNNCINAPWRVGLTGTLDEGKTNEMTLTGLFGQVFEVISTRELMDRGTVAQLHINVAILKHKKESCKCLRSDDRGPIDEKTGKPSKRKANYAEEIDHIVSNKDRNLFLMRHTASLKGNSILMVNKVEHGQNLYKWMKEAYPDRDIYLYTGATKSKERDYIRKVMEESENAIIIGSLGVLSTGISIKRLHNLVFAHPSKSRIKVLQTVGRLLRKSKFGNNVVMYDIVDDYCIGAYENYVYSHGQKRVQYYSDQQFSFDIINLDL